MSKSFLYARSYPAEYPEGKNRIDIVVPTMRDILENEDAYNSLVSSVLATPSDYMVQLDDKGIDFEKLRPFDLFLMFFEGLKECDTHLVFGDLDLSNFEYAENESNGKIVLLDTKNDIVINEGVHNQICWVLRKINHLEKNIRRPGNEEAKKYMIERARIKQKRAAKRPRKSQLEDLIIALVNTEQFKYGYEGVLDLTVYQFYSSVHQIVKKVNYDNLMFGCYSGTVNSKEISQDKFNWLTSK